MLKENDELAIFCLNLKHVILLKKILGNHFLSKYLYIKRKIFGEKNTTNKNSQFPVENRLTQIQQTTGKMKSTIAILSSCNCFLEYNQRCLLPSQGRYPYILEKV